MTQHRLHEFGGSLDDTHWQKMFLAMCRNKFLYGFEITITSAGDGTISIAPGSVVLDSGVMLVETEAKEMTIPLGVPNKNYTLYYHHASAQIIGGTAAVLTLAEGLLFQETTTDEKIPIAWIIYPGANAALAESHIVRPMTVHDTMTDSKNPPMSTAPFVDTADANITLGSFLSSGVVRHRLTLGAAAGAPVSEDLVIPLWYKGFGKPRFITLDLKVSSGTSITALAVYDIEGNSVSYTLEAGTLPLTPSTFTTYELKLSPVGAVWDTAGFFAVKITSTIAVSGTVEVTNATSWIMGGAE